MSKSASPRNQTKIPPIKNRPLRKIDCRSLPACWMKPKIFSEITGRTHGIKFKMSPPTNPKKRNVSRPRLGCAIRAAAAICGAPISHAVRSLLFGNFENTIRPGMDDRLLSGFSMGSRKVTSSDLRDSTLGCPTTVLPCGAGKKSKFW